jgi:hypothetical protein
VSIKLSRAFLLSGSFYLDAFAVADLATSGTEAKAIRRALMDKAACHTNSHQGNITSSHSNRTDLQSLAVALIAVMDRRYVHTAETEYVHIAAFALH